jgi:NADPH2:quinone reductase
VTFATIQTMKAALVREWSNPQCFELAEVESPPPGPGELLVAVHTAGVNFGDTLIATGRYQIRPQLPFIPGTECSGVVEAVGDGVTDFAPGDHIAICGFIGDARKDGRIVGSFAERTVVPTANAVRVPPGIPLDQAALFRSNMETSLHGLKRGALKEGETLLVLGAGGGTGLAAVQLGKWLGARVIASASSEEKRSLALEAGADVAIDSRDAEWRNRVKQLTDGRGIDVVYDPVGGAATEQAFRSLAWGGRLVVIGFAAGAIPTIPANLALLKGASLVGANLLEAQRFEPETVMADRTELMELFAAGKLKVPPIARRYPLGQVGEALQAVAGGEVAGRIVIDVAGKGEA